MPVYLIMKELVVPCTLAVYVRNNVFLVELTVTGNVLPQNVPSSVAAVLFPSYTFNVFWLQLCRSNVMYFKLSTCKQRRQPK